MAQSAEQKRRDQAVRRAVLRRLSCEEPDKYRRWYADARNDYDKEQR